MSCEQKPQNRRVERVEDIDYIEEHRKGMTISHRKENTSNCKHEHGSIRKYIITNNIMYMYQQAL